MKKILLLITAAALLPFSSCLDDSVQPEFSVELENSAELLTYFESQGDYINSDLFPSLLDADDVLNNLSDYVILDVRDSSLYLAGHIESAVNVNHADLLNYIEKSFQSSSQRSVIISESGQSASYYTCLLRLLGYENVFAMKFGMAIWHNDFADIWIDSQNNPKDYWKFDNIIYHKPGYSSLPGVSFNVEGTIEEKLRSRINELLVQGFEEKIIIEPIINSPTPIFNKITEESDPTIDIFELFSFWNSIESNFNNHYVICYGDNQLYHPYGFAGSQDSLPAHLPKSVFYKSPIFSELRTITFLQSIPSHNVVAVYSASGHESAFITAYLRLLGYKAKSMLYGASYFNYTAIFLKANLTHLIFNQMAIRNYPYLVGN